MTPRHLNALLCGVNCSNVFEFTQYNEPSKHLVRVRKAKKSIKMSYRCLLCNKSYDVKGYDMKGSLTRHQTRLS